MFAALAYDRTLPKIKSSKPSKSGKGASPVVSTVSPSQVKVMVYNGTTAPTLAGDTATQLTARGFVVTGIADTATATWTTTVIEYGSDADLPAVNTLRGQFDSSVTVRLVADADSGDHPADLGHGGLVPAAGAGAGHHARATSVGGLAQPYNGITGNVRCRDGAFYGPNLPAPTPTGATATPSPSGSATTVGSSASAGTASCSC